MRLPLAQVFTFAALSAMINAQTKPQSAVTPHVLVYTATAGYRHDSIPTAIDVLGQQAASWGVSFTFSEDPNLFTNETLSTFDCVMFVSNSDEVLNATGQAALQTFFQSGGAYMGVHAASACLFNDTNYAAAVGALFDYHPTIQFAAFERLNDTHPATADLPDRWYYEEEIYYFRSDPRSAGANVIMTVDNTSYTDDGTSSGNYPDQGTPHPIAWYIDSPESAQPLADGVSKAGRSFYTSLGHLNSTWQNDTFINHVMNGLVWALDGASTRAYGAGLVGNSSTSNNASSSSSTSGSSASGTTSILASHTGSASASASQSASGSSSAASPIASLALGSMFVAVGALWMIL